MKRREDAERPHCAALQAAALHGSEACDVTTTEVAVDPALLLQAVPTTREFEVSRAAPTRVLCAGDTGQPEEDEDEDDRPTLVRRRPSRPAAAKAHSNASRSDERWKKQVWMSSKERTSATDRARQDFQKASEGFMAAAGGERSHLLATTRELMADEPFRSMPPRPLRKPATGDLPLIGTNAWRLGHCLRTCGEQGAREPSEGTPGARDWGLALPVRDAGRPKRQEARRRDGYPRGLAPKGKRHKRRHKKMPELAFDPPAFAAHWPRRGYDELAVSVARMDSPATGTVAKKLRSCHTVELTIKKPAKRKHQKMFHRDARTGLREAQQVAPKAHGPRCQRGCDVVQKKTTVASETLRSAKGLRTAALRGRSRDGSPLSAMAQISTIRVGGILLGLGVIGVVVGMVLAIGARWALGA